jgi:hypothetical protein
MKHLKLFILSLIYLLLIGWVCAEEINSSISSIQDLEDETSELEEKGSIEKERIKSWFTFNKEKKVEIELKIARLRLNQARIALKNNNTQAMEKALEAHNRIMNRVELRVEKIKSEKNNSSKMTGINRAIEVHQRRIAILENILDNKNLTEKQKEKIEIKLEKAKERQVKLLNLRENITERRTQKIDDGGLVTKDNRNSRNNLQEEADLEI